MTEYFSSDNSHLSELALFPHIYTSGWNLCSRAVWDGFRRDHWLQGLCFVIHGDTGAGTDFSVAAVMLFMSSSRLF